VTVAAPAPAAHPDLGLVVAVRPGDGIGFRLSGAPVEEIPPGEEGRAFAALLARPGLAVVAVEAELHAAAAEALRARRRGGGLPVVIPFALPRRHAEPGRGRELVAAIVRRAVGYHVKLGEGRS
jgi:V/A-type H+/Na+-transporting ATPase subunit F